jgi:hypothetical protein
MLIQIVVDPCHDVGHARIEQPFRAKPRRESFGSESGMGFASELTEWYCRDNEWTFCLRSSNLKIVRKMSRWYLNSQTSLGQ